MKTPSPTSPSSASAAEIVDQLKPLGSDSYRKVLLNHGAREPVVGVKISELKKFQQRIKKDYRLSLELFDTGIYDAMYLAGLIADDSQMTKADLQRWVGKACGPLAGSTVPWVAAGSPQGWEIALEWIDSDNEMILTAGWTTLSGLVSTKADADLDLDKLKQLLERVHRSILDAPNAARYAMNSFVIAVGSYVCPLSAFAKEVGEKIGLVPVDMGNTACTVPFAPDYIRKVESRGAVGKKRKTVKC